MSNPYENLPEGVAGRAFAEFRVTDEDGTEIEGHAATFNQPYRVRDFMEQVAPGAFDGVLGDDVFALVNHNPDKVLGRTSSGTLEIGVDDTGLWTRIDLPNTTDGEDVRELVGRGDLSEMSFGFRVAEDTWSQMDDGTELRTIERIEQLYDVSPVTMAANKFTDLAIREALESRSRWHEMQETRDAEAEAEAADGEAQAESDDEYPQLTREALHALRDELGMDRPTLEEMANRLEEHAEVLRQRSKDFEEADEGADDPEQDDGTVLDAGTLRRKHELAVAESS